MTPMQNAVVNSCLACFRNFPSGSATNTFLLVANVLYPTILRRHSSVCATMPAVTA
jgi:hypothetical protein